MCRLFVLMLLAAAIAPASGCRMVRATEQWKCDNLGLCWFGIQPSNRPPYQYQNYQDGVVPEGVTPGP
jgi:hypothetical protein